jgi:thiamine monophosphate kinase
LQLAGGDDYELLVCGEAAEIEALPAFARGELTWIGRIDSMQGLRFERGGAPFEYRPERSGYDHFI